MTHCNHYVSKMNGVNIVIRINDSRIIHEEKAFISLKRERERGRKYKEENSEKRYYE